MNNKYNNVDRTYIQIYIINKINFTIRMSIIRIKRLLRRQEEL